MRNLNPKVKGESGHTGRATPAVRVCNVSKRFRLGESHDSLRDLLASAWTYCRRRPSSHSRTRRIFWALRDVGFAVSSGEAVGIIGPNGAGKSTILKLLAGILRADAGTVEVQGRLAALIEVGAGFHGDLTGRENIFLNGAILGMTRQEIRSKLDAIAAFAGLGKG
ncbi:MAG: ABC transporter ATP-binding protein, partial [Planctomycetes bacterium]|nr:ABC transporter ATP-binding protein [Planctomycetota bacterium]